LRLRRRRHLVGIAVARLASDVAERAMNGAAQVRSLIAVARRALNLCHFLGVREILDTAIAVVASQRSVDAGCMPAGINGDTFAADRGHPRLAVASRAAFIVLQRMAPWVELELWRVSAPILKANIARKTGSQSELR
jgi:hypothetical protein